MGAQRLMDLCHDVVAMTLSATVLWYRRRQVECRAVLWHLQVASVEGHFATLVEYRLTRRNQDVQRPCLVDDEVLRLVEKEAGRLGATTGCSVRILYEELAQTGGGELALVVPK